MRSKYQNQEGQPFHISVGAILVNQEGEICVHAVQKRDVRQDVREAMDSVGIDTAYYLMRESLEDGETLEEAVLRGIYEEFGATGTVTKYLGAISGRGFSEIGMLEKMGPQRGITIRDDMDESKIIEAYIQYGKS